MRKLFSIICTLLATAAMAQAPAFPGAEGHGRYDNLVRVPSSSTSAVSLN